MTATTEPTVHEIGDAHHRLDVFVGTWHTEGTSFADGQTTDDPRASGVRWTSDEHYEWLPGGFFLLHQWDALAGTREFKGTEIIGYDEADGGYFTRFFDNAGSIPSTRQPSMVTSGSSPNHRHGRPSPYETVATTSSTLGSGYNAARGSRSASEQRRARER